MIPILVVIAALMDGFYDEKKKLISSLFKSLFIVGICYFLIREGDLWDVVYLLLCWWILFDIVYNIVRGIGMFYVGHTKWTDKLLRAIFRTNAPHFSFVTKLMALAGVIAMFYTGKI